MASRALLPKEIKRVFKLTDLMAHSESKKACLALSHIGLRVTEIALLEVVSILNKDGSVKEESALPSKITKFCKPRTVWLKNPLFKEAIHEWIEFRNKHRWGTIPETIKYRTLNPNSRLIFSNRGKPYSLQPKPRMTEQGIIEYWASDSLEALFRSIYKKCGFHGASSHSGRRSLCTNFINAGVDIYTVVGFLGHDSPNTTIYYYSARLELIVHSSAYDVDLNEFD